MGVKSGKEFEVIGSSEADKLMRQNLAQFLNNVTFDEVYCKVVREVQDNFERINMFNLLKEIQNSHNKNKKKFVKNVKNRK